MRFFVSLPSISFNQARLLDIALVIAMLPHLFILKLPMVIYLLISLFFMGKPQGKKSIMGFMLLGLLAIFLSFFDQYNLSSLSRLLIFVSLILSLLVHAVILQRLTQEINLYLKISPALLMVLSFFYFNSISMLFYALFALFSFTFLILQYAMQSRDLGQLLRINVMLYLLSLPMVVFLFIVFPRISYKDASFGFQGESTKRSGHDGTMYLDSNALLVPSKKLVMEVSFKERIPADSLLYFRGSVLYEDRGDQWVEGEKATFTNPYPAKSDNSIEYRIKLYPHEQDWLYLLDLPLGYPKDAKGDTNYITHANKPITEIYQYDARSALRYISLPLQADVLSKASKVDIQKGPKVYQELKNKIDFNAPSPLKATALVNYFRSKELAYSLKPEAIDLNRPLDSFLLEGKTGYCVHFAASFATAARMIGIPSRIVTGYKASRKNGIENYLIVTQADAHAWVELYLDKQGWVRFEPTATASRVINVSNETLSNTYTQAYLQQSWWQKSFEQLNLYYLYTRHVISTWILQYDRFKQTKLLETLLSNTFALIKFVGALIGLALVSYFLFYVMQRSRPKDPLIKQMQVLIKLLNKEGFVMHKGENIESFLKRVKVCDEKYTLLGSISANYHQARYAKESNGAIEAIQSEIKSLKKRLKSG